MIRGLRAEDSNGRILVKYEDMLTLDLSAVMEHLFDKIFGSDTIPDNVIRIQERKHEPSRQPD